MAISLRPAAKGPFLRPDPGERGPDASTEDALCALMRVRGALMWARDLPCIPTSLRPAERCPVPAMDEWFPGSCLSGSSPRPGTGEGCLARAVVLGSCLRVLVSQRSGRQRCRFHKSGLWVLVKSGADSVRDVFICMWRRVGLGMTAAAPTTVPPLT